MWKTNDMFKCRPRNNGSLYKIYRHFLANSHQYLLVVVFKGGHLSAAPIVVKADGRHCGQIWHLFHQRFCAEKNWFSYYRLARWFVCHKRFYSHAHLQLRFVSIVFVQQAFLKWQQQALKKIGNFLLSILANGCRSRLSVIPTAMPMIWKRYRWC